jgi:hypothetical protein
MKRVRLQLDDGAYMDVNFDDNVTHETIETLRAIGNAAAARMRSQLRSFDSRRVATRRPLTTAQLKRRRRG